MKINLIVAAILASIAVLFLAFGVSDWKSFGLDRWTTIAYILIGIVFMIGAFMSTKGKK